jgi:hypothetical protein
LGSAEIASWLQPGLAVGEKLSECHSLFSTVTVLSPKLAQDKQKLSKSNRRYLTAGKGIYLNFLLDSESAI